MGWWGGVGKESEREREGMRETERGKENKRKKGKKTANSILTDISTGMVRGARGRGWRVEERSGEEREGNNTGGCCGEVCVGRGGLRMQ